MMRAGSGKLRETTGWLLKGIAGLGARAKAGVTKNLHVCPLKWAAYLRGEGGLCDVCGVEDERAFRELLAATERTAYDFRHGVGICRRRWPRLASGLHHLSIEARRSVGMTPDEKALP